MVFTFEILILLCVAIVQAVKRLKIRSAWLPFISIAIGILLSFLGGTSVVIQRTILDGVIIGLSGCGLYDFSKKTILRK